MAPTGSGKTLAFLIPLLNDAIQCCESNDKVLIYIIVTPTKDLAFQIKDICAKLVNNLGIPLKVAALTGGMFSEKQKRVLKAGVNLLISTPGRLRDLVDLKIDFSFLRCAIFDEADRCLDPIQTSFKDINVSMRKIMSSIKEKSLFTLTFASASLDPSKIQGNTFAAMKPLSLKKANVITSNIKTSHKIADYIYHVLEEDKLALLLTLLDQPSNKKILIFVKTISEISKMKKISQSLQKKILKIDSTSRMGTRGRIIEKAFKSDSCICISTDLTARGIDFKGFDCVVQYSMPDDLSQFIHRRGRTGRDCSGANYLFVTPKDSLSMEKVIIRNYKVQNLDIDLDQIEKMQENIEKAEKFKGFRNSSSESYSSELKKFAEELGQSID